MTDPLEGIDLVIFDKDGTIIEFHAMWSAWAISLARDLEAATGRLVTPPLFALLGVDAATGLVDPHGRLAATPMARLREATAALLADLGLDGPAAERALVAAWHAPDPVALAYPVTDLRALFTALRRRGCRIAVATSDDRGPTERTLEALGVAASLEAVVCADDGVPVKPAGDAVLAICAATGVAATRTAVVGDSVADLAMGRAAGAGRCYGVLTGVSTRAELAPLADGVFDSIGGLIAV